MNLFGGYILASIVNPYVLEEKKTKLIIEKNKEQTFFQMLGEYILDGFHVAITVAAMLIGFVALIARSDAIFHGIFGITFQEILVISLPPLAFISGIPWKEAVDAGIMATKLVTNEFVAMTELANGHFHFTERTTAIVSVFLVSFANFSSIGIVSGAMKGLNERKRKSCHKTRIENFANSDFSQLFKCYCDWITGIINKKRRCFQKALEIFPKLFQLLKYQRRNDDELLLCVYRTFWFWENFTRRSCFQPNKRSCLTRIDRQDLEKKIEGIIILYLTMHSIR